MIKNKTLLICLLTVSSAFTLETRRIITGSTILTSSLLKTIDGKPYGLHGKTIRAILTIHTRLSRMLQGKPDGNGSRIGNYTFNNTAYTIRQLQSVELNNTLDTATRDAWLKEVKADFAVQINPFLELGRGFKPQMLIFIEESLKLHHRQASILHMWAEEPEGQDMIAFEQKVISFDALATFLDDLLNFLDDLISSCPKARTQFINSLSNDREKALYTQRFKKVFETQKAKINNLHQ